MFEGMAQSNLGANWGDGHATDAGSMAKINPDANPNAFYQQLLVSAYASNAIISTHIYGCALFSLSRVERSIRYVSEHGDIAGTAVSFYLLHFVNQ